MANFKIVVFILAVMIILIAITNRRKLPYPILLLAAGLIIGFAPGLPELALDPDVVFFIILPPLLYDAAYKTSWHEFKTSIRPISALAISLVFFTTLTVAVTAHYIIPGFTWPLAFVLGAVISPPDAVAASGIIKGMGLHKKVVTILEGESLVNDASALIAYRYAVAAVSTGAFVFWEAGLGFLMVAIVGIIIGVATGYIFVAAHKRIENNSVVETSLTLLAPFISYHAAEYFHMSGVLAVVSTGLVMSWRSPEVFSYQTRMRTRLVWDTLIFLMQGFVFILIGLQLPAIVRGMGSYPLEEILGYGILISLVTIVVRIIWVFAGANIQRIFEKNSGHTLSVAENEASKNTWKNVLLVAWTGTRGVISLAAALALPLVMANGEPFPKRDSIIFLAFVVIFVTLVVQGLTLPLLIRWLRIEPADDGAHEQRELQLYMATSTLNFVEQDMPVDNGDVKVTLKKKYDSIIRQLTVEHRRHQKMARSKEVPVPSEPNDMLKAQLEISKFQRNLLLRLHKEGDFANGVIKDAERELDINDLKLNLQVPKEV